MNSRRVVFVHPALTQYRLGLYDAMVERLDPHFVFLGYEEQTRYYLPRTRVRRYSLWPAGALGPYRQGVSRELLRFAARGDYDVWIGSIVNNFSTHAASPVVRWRRKPFLMWSEDWWWPTGIEGRFARLFGGWIARSAAALVVASTKSRQFFVSAGADPARIVVAPNACAVPRSGSPQEIRAVHADVPAGKGPLFLYLNRVVEYKGLDVLLRAFARLALERAEARLVVVGDGPFRPACERLAGELGLGSRVRFVGAVAPESVGAWYDVADVYVHPARLLPSGRVRAEAWGFTINEALSLGCPVVATDAVAAAVDLVEEESSGHVVPSGDVDALADALARIGRRTDRPQMGERGRCRVLSEFTPRRQAEGFAAAVDIACAHGSGAR